MQFAVHHSYFTKDFQMLLATNNADKVNLAKKKKIDYRNDPTFSDRLVWANSVDPDQTAPRGAV